MPRFVVLTHEHPRGLHWDLMLEQGASLGTWALGEEPAADRTIVAEALPDHRLAYLDYEGPISGGRGRATRWDWGEYTLLEKSDQTVRALLEGERLRGVVELQRKADRWTFTYCPVAGV